MKTLRQILQSVTYIHLEGDAEMGVEHLTQDASTAQKGSLFFAVKGLKTDGHQYISRAIEKGATVIVCETLPTYYQDHKEVTWVQVPDSRQVMGYIASSFFDHPSQKLMLIGVTGTNGKSSVATLLYELFTNLGKQCGLISTVNYIVSKTTYTSTHTTPDPIILNTLFHTMVEQGCTYAFMEVSSIAVHQGRINGLQFKGALFTNLSHDHLDYHGTFSNYLQCKKQWFDGLSDDAFSLSNTDDKNGKIILQNTRSSRYYFGIKKMADFKLKIIESDLNGMLLQYKEHEFWVRLTGIFNAYNLAAVLGTAFLCGFEEEEIIIAMSGLKGARGRFETLAGPEKRTGIVDYAHTPDALKNVLETINRVRTGNETLWVVFGCGGNRDASKRPIMGCIAAQHADRVVITSDNPRNEKPEQIIQDIQAGIPAQYFKKILSITDRAAAIRTAVLTSNPNDIILVAGKGHETYQIIEDQKLHFDDASQLNQYFNLLKTP